MHHRVFGRKFSRTKNERRRLFQGLVRELVRGGKIRTTLARAKATRGLIDKLVSKAKQGDQLGKLAVEKILADKILVEKLVAESKTRFSARTSGFTRIIRIGSRAGDAAEIVILTWVDALPTPQVKPTEIKASQKQEQVPPKTPKILKKIK